MTQPVPRYPIFVPSKGRATVCYTARFLEQDGTPFRLVVEPQEEAWYRRHFPTADLLLTPEDDYGSVVPVRNWIRDLSIEEGHARHWQIDDNCRMIRRLYKGRRIRCNSSIALRVVEDFTDRYTNIGVSGLNYYMFVSDVTAHPYWLNTHVYSCSLVSNDMPYRWRAVYNEDTDLCLQVLAGGLCTVQVNQFHIQKIRTGQIRGGNTDALYQGDGRLKMARSLERQWPHVVTVDRRYQRPQHKVRGVWRGFDTPLERRTDLDWSAIEGTTNEYGMNLVQVEPEVRSKRLQGLRDGWAAGALAEEPARD